MTVFMVLTPYSLVYINNSKNILQLLKIIRVHPVVYVIKIVWIKYPPDTLRVYHYT
jgi:hypothetical protein